MGQDKAKRLFCVEDILPVRSIEEKTVMKNIKSVLDPDGLMNPGKIFYCNEETEVHSC